MPVAGRLGAGASAACAGGWLRIPAAAPAGALQKDGAGRAQQILVQQPPASTCPASTQTQSGIFRDWKRWKNKPRQPRQRAQMLTFMSQPETTCSSSHLQARGSAGRLRLVVFRNQASRAAGVPPPSGLSDPAPAMEQPLGLPGISAWGQAPVPLGSPSPGNQRGRVGPFHHCSTTWAPLPTQKGLENTQGYLASD